MKFGVVNKSTILNRFVLHTLQRNITRLAVITRKTNIKLGIFKGGNWKRALFKFIFFAFCAWTSLCRKIETIQNVITFCYLSRVSIQNTFHIQNPTKKNISFPAVLNLKVGRDFTEN